MPPAAGMVDLMVERPLAAVDGSQVMRPYSLAPSIKCSLLLALHQVSEPTPMGMLCEDN